VQKGFSDYLFGNSDVSALRYESAAASHTGLYVREIAAGCILGLQEKLQAPARAEELLGRTLSEQERQRITERVDAFREKSKPLYTVEGTAENTVGPRNIFTAVYARFYGFAAFAVLLCMMTISGGIGGEAYRLCNERLAAVGGRALCISTDIAALSMVGVSVFAAAAFVHGLTAFGALNGICYVFCVACALRLLSGSTASAGRISLAAPLAAFLTSLLGGCFADLSALGKGLRLLALFTPQGLLLRGIESGALWPAAVMFAAGAVFVLADSKMKLRQSPQN